MIEPNNSILTKMLDRLFAAMLNGPSMNCRPHASRQRLDEDCPDLVALSGPYIHYDLPAPARLVAAGFYRAVYIVHLLSRVVAGAGVVLASSSLEPRPLRLMLFSLIGLSDKPGATASKASGC